MKTNPVVVVSSTAQDLEKYRSLVTDACLRADMFPKMMEQLPALSEDAIRASLDMVNQADVYVGIFAHRYGYIPAGHHISITEMEYERAVERGIPLLIFIMDDDVPVLPKDFDTDNAEKLKALKQRLRQKHVVASFTSPEDLRGLVVDSLAKARAAMDSAQTDTTGQPTPAALARSIHYVSDIPQPPEPYIAHPYTLLQVRGLVGRKEELEMLTDWVTGDPRYADVRIFNVVAIGGMGKSALTWTWFNEVAPQEMKPLAGRLWWSFYESDATFENFVTRALAYVSRRPLDEVKQLPFPEQEDRLLRILNQKPFLLALDGLERILIGYARLDAAYLRDDAVDQTPQAKHKLRKTADLSAGRFLRKLAGVHASRVLVSTRLYPAELEAPGGEPSPGCYSLLLEGLSAQDALALWRAYGAKGSREQMLPVFDTFGRHPLLLQLLAYEVAEFREAPGDFDIWKSANPDFNPFGMSLVQVQSHVLEQALRGLSAAELRTLRVVAGFRMPASIETLKALLIHAMDDDDPRQKPFATTSELDRALTTLEDRGLLGWDRRANRYDLHPIVRGVVWSGLDKRARVSLYSTLCTYFEAIPMVDVLEVESVADITPALELYNALIGSGRYEDAFQVFVDRLRHATAYRLCAGELQAELLKSLLPVASDGIPRLSRSHDQGLILTALGQAYQLSGRPIAAVPVLRLIDERNLHENDPEKKSVVLRNLSEVLRLSGKIREAESSARESLILARMTTERLGERVSLFRMGIALAVRGSTHAASEALERSLRIIAVKGNPQVEGVVRASLAQIAFWEGDAATAKRLAEEVASLAGVLELAGDLSRAVRLQGTAALMMNESGAARELLRRALLQARAISFVEEELPCLVSMAELQHRQGQAASARGFLQELWDAAERGPYPLFHADALNVLAQIERDEGNRDAAVEAATKAYQLAWCDGPPFAYHWGLEKAKAHLAALGAPEPDMPPFDESKYEPMPEVEINPPDEFGGEDAPDDFSMLDEEE